MQNIVNSIFDSIDELIESALDYSNSAERKSNASITDIIMELNRNVPDNVPEIGIRFAR